VRTLQERLLSDLGLSREEVCSFASWDVMHHAVESREGSHFANCGTQTYSPSRKEDGAETTSAELPPQVQQILNDLFGGKTLQEFNELQHSDIPQWHHARKDIYTFGLALHHLASYKPRFMFLSLNDLDEYGHLSDYPKYISTLSQPR